MLQKRFGGSDETEQSGEIAAMETMRSAASSSAAKPDEKKDEEKVSVFWRVFGGTLLSIVALAGVTLYNNISSNITELRAALAQEREARTALAKKEDVDARMKTQYERMRTVEGYRTDIETIKERTNANAVAVEALRKDSASALDVVKRETAGLEVLKERVAALDALKKDVAGLEVQKERLAALAVDLKTARDDLMKLQTELEKNKANDMERKQFRDAQSKQIDDTLKELQKGLQDCREKLARLEGAGKGTPVPPKSDE